MRALRLIRIEESIEGTFGVLLFDAKIFCVTLECPDLLNIKNKSSIPAKQYTCKQILSPRFGETFEICNVPGRSHICFHPGNTVLDTEGCIMLGNLVGELSGRRAILNSKETFKKFIHKTQNIDQFHLTIIECF